MDLAEGDVYPVILHGGVEVLLDYRTQAVYLVNEQHISCIEVREQPRQVARFVEHRAAGHPERRPHLIGDDVGEGGLPEPRRAMEQYMVERIAAHQCCPYEDTQILRHLLLAAEVVQFLRAYPVLELRIALHIPSVPVECHTAKIALIPNFT